RETRPFPTRRSSDLRIAGGVADTRFLEQERTRRSAVGIEFLKPMRRLSNLTFAHRPIQALHEHLIDWIGVLEMGQYILAAPGILDRKSTRLNSSHQI